MLGHLVQGVFDRQGERGGTFRELRAIEEGFRAHGDSLCGMVVRWGSDNWSAGMIVKYGSMKRDCHEVAVKIEELYRRYEIRL